MALNHRQRAFVAVYAGNATEAARQAGYVGNARTLEATGSRLMRHDEVRAAVEARQTEALRPAVADRQEVEELLTKRLRDTEDPDLQLRAIAQLAKMKAWNSSKLELTGKVTLEQMINEATKKPEATRCLSALDLGHIEGRAKKLPCRLQAGHDGPHEWADSEPSKQQEPT